MSRFLRATAGRAAGICILALLVSRPDTAFAGPPGNSERITLRADPPAVVMGGKQKVRLTIEGACLRGRPRVRATAGKLGAVRAAGKDTWRVSWTPPLRAKPDIAMIAASGSDPNCVPGFVAVPLQVEENLQVRAAPNARVTLRIGKQAYGPTRADARGRVEIPARLSPGHPRGVLEMVLPGGKHRRKKLPLGVPSKPRIGVVTVPAAVRADGVSGSRIYLFAVDPTGRTLRHARFALGSREGRAGKPQPAGEGVYTVLFRPRRSLTGGRARIKARLLKPYRGTRTFFLRLLPGMDLDIQAQVTPARLVSNGESRARLTARVLDSSGKGLEKLPIEIVAPALRVGPVTELGGGSYQAELVAPLGGEGPVPVKVKIGKQAETLRVELVPPPPLEITAEPTVLVADGKSTARLAVRAFGPGGASEAKEVCLSSSLGSVPERIALAGTRAETIFRAGTRAGTARIEARIGAASDQLELVLEPGPPARLELSAAADEVLADGETQLAVHIAITDAHDNPVPGVHPALTASVGKLGPVREVAPGLLQCDYLPPAGGGGTSVIRAAVSGGVGDELGIRLRPPPARFGLAVSAGIEHNLARIGAPLVSLEASLRIAGSLFALAGAGWFGNQVDAACPQGPAGCEAQLRLDAVPLWLGLAYRFENGSRWTPTVGAGAAAVWSRAAASPGFQPEVIENRVQPAGFARAGVELEAGVGGVMLEIGYTFIPWLGSDVITGQLGGLSARAGYRFAF